jgi:hypothetical protein
MAQRLNVERLCGSCAGCPDHGTLTTRQRVARSEHGREGRGEVQRHALSSRRLGGPACLPPASHFLAWPA